MRKQPTCEMDPQKRQYEALKQNVSRLFATGESILKMLLRTRPCGPLPAYSGKPALALGSAPSFNTFLETLSPSDWQQFELFATNNFARHPSYTELKPRYYVLLDPGYWEVDRLPKPVQQKIYATWEALAERTDWPMNIFLTRRARNTEIVKRYRQVENLKFHYFNYVIYNGFERFGHWLYSRNLAAPSMRLAGNIAVYLSLLVGAKHTYTVGIENSYIKTLVLDEENVLYFGDGTYDDRSAETAFERFQPVRQSLSQFLEGIISSNDNFALLDRWARSRGGAVYNATPQSMIDTLERRPLPLH